MEEIRASREELSGHEESPGIAKATSSTYTILTIPGPELSKDYRGYLVAKWIRSLHRGNETFSKIDYKVLWSNYPNYIDKVLSLPFSTVRLAVLSDDKDVVLGFAIYRQSTLDYVYVQTEFRRQGIGFALIPKEITSYTHITKDGSHFGRYK